ncbi:phosphotransferase enzyme family protein [Deminuibacter soli]|uniref:Aminoglycoside phosphotransferase family protein n=1 Tax=Deminuibacter soli TaxID=2291815 RepID=A0A3E1NKW7_9BACT|nr:aminoglycoside phosphotransferase family protein [Deminuibacter soli]RFM28580.1 aminoglycoside phosphotransferase family protein [Deminuibacter soli]
MFSRILAAYGLRADECIIQQFGSGLINRTWKVTHNSDNYILQHINQQIFKQPADIASNTAVLAAWLQVHAPGYLFVAQINTLANESLFYDAAQGYFRLTPFIEGSQSYDVVPSGNIGYEAAKQFGRFAHLLSGFPAGQLHTTIPDFHNLTLRYRQFEQALANGNRERIAECADSIRLIQQYSSITQTYEAIQHNPHFKKRVTHHDTKISNVLFDAQGNGLCVIDLDTVMPGYFISDFGDMMRTYLSPASEEEQDTSKVYVREEYFRALVSGYLSEMKDELTAAETAHIVYAGKFMTYMQAMRFLTDYLNNDIYYGAAYEKHNLVRARNQLKLLQSIAEKEPVLLAMIDFVPQHLS